MAVFRFLASLFLLIAVIALVADATPVSHGSGSFTATSFAKHWGDLAPSTLQSAKEGVSRATFPWVWDTIIVPVLAVPTFLLFGVLALLSGYAGRRRHRVDIYIN